MESCVPTMAAGVLSKGTVLHCCMRCFLSFAYAGQKTGSCDAPNLYLHDCHPCNHCLAYLYVTQLLKTLGARTIDLRMSVSRAENAG